MSRNDRTSGPGRKGRRFRRAMSDARTDTSEQHPLRRLAAWTVPTVAAAIIASIVAANTDAIESWWSTRDPLEARIVPRTEAPESYSMVVPDPTLLPPNVGDINDCSALWEVGIEAEGIDSTTPVVLLEGTATDGVAITGMRAKITKRKPAIDGALLTCPSAGGQPPIGMVFDLRTSSLAHAKHIDARSNEEVAQFADGFTITVAESEKVTLDTEVRLPGDAVYWNIEADLLVDGEPRTLIIDNNGEDFYSPGFRDVNNYRKGYGAGVEPQNWGIDDDARQVQLPGGASALHFGSLIFPGASGLDVYQPRELYGSTGDSSPYRWIRRDGRRVLQFNPDGVPAKPLPTAGDGCHSGPDEQEDDTKYGRISSTRAERSLIREHHGQPFAHLVMEIRCQFSNEWEQSYHFQAAWPVGGITVFSFSTNEIAQEDQPQAERLLNDVRIAR